MRVRARHVGTTFTLAAVMVIGGCSSSDTPKSTGSAGHGGGGSGGAVTGNGGGGSGGAVTGSGGGGAGGGTGGAITDGGTDWPFTTVDIPAALAVPAGATLKVRYHATGDQVYTCAAMAGTDGGASTYAWTLKTPDAKLFDTHSAQTGTHSMGPTWTSTDGSSILGTKLAQANSPLADAIPWLLLSAAPTGTGIFSDVTYVQRLNTTKGKAPATGCDATTPATTEMRVAYTADYYFYTGGANADGGADAGWPFTTVDIPAALAVPAGATLKVRYHATGAQVYTCAAMAGTDGGASTYAWTLKAPDAKLFNEQNVQAGTHSMGPTWTSTDGSSILGTKLAQANSALADAIPWLLLSTVPTGTGIFSDVTYVQRLNTTKGKAPATGCDATTPAATEVRVDYTADYYFYKGGAADGGTGG